MRRDRVRRHARLRLMKWDLDSHTSSRSLTHPAGNLNNKPAARIDHTAQPDTEPALNHFALKPLALGFRPSYDRPTAPANGADPSGVSMFRTRETRLGPGALFTPGTTVPSRPVNLPDRRTPPSSGRPLFTPVQHSAPGCNCDEASSRVHWRSPLPALPSPVIPGTVRGPSGFSLSSAPG